MMCSVPTSYGVYKIVYSPKWKFFKWRWYYDLLEYDTLPTHIDVGKITSENTFLLYNRFTVQYYILAAT